MLKEEYLGNRELLKLKKTAFLASSTISSETVLRCYDWATEMRNRGECVVSGFSSKLEQDVLHFLLKGSQPIIIVLARRMYRDIPDELKEPLAQNRLLIISVSNAVRQSKVTAMACLWLPTDAGVWIRCRLSLQMPIHILRTTTRETGCRMLSAVLPASGSIPARFFS